MVHTSLTYVQVYPAHALEHFLTFLHCLCYLFSYVPPLSSPLLILAGCAFTRFQTMRLTQAFPSVLSDQLISYGPCQFPTLGFVVERVGVWTLMYVCDMCL